MMLGENMITGNYESNENIPGTFRNSPRTTPEHPRNTPGTRPEHPQNTPRTPPEHARITAGVCPGEHIGDELVGGTHLAGSKQRACLFLFSVSQKVIIGLARLRLIAAQLNPVGGGALRGPPGGVHPQFP
jgi:hypothetical protein